jgi:hypothetical protein
MNVNVLCLSDASQAIAYDKIAAWQHLRQLQFKSHGNCEGDVARHASLATLHRGGMTMVRRKSKLISLMFIMGVVLAVCTTMLANRASASSCNYNGCTVTLVGHIYLDNNWWGVSSDKASGFQSVYTNGSNNAWASQVNWNAGNNQYGVKSYSGPYDGWNYSSGFNGAPFPKQLAGHSAANNYINGYYATNGSQDSIWDAFYYWSNNPGYNPGNPQMETEVYITASFYPSNPAYQTYEDGWTWNVYGPGNGAWPVWLFVPLNYTSSENFNLMDLANDLVNHGKCSEWLYMENDNFGEEVYYTNGTSYFGCSAFSSP